jgi:flagellar motility protein MotE (MotC chaperone)
MADTPESTGTKNKGQNEHFNVWNRIPVIRRFSFPIIIIVFAALVIVKVVLSGFYLNHTNFPLDPRGLALAEEEAQPSMNPGGLSAILKKKEAALNTKEEQLRKREAELLQLEQDVEIKMEELNDLQLRLTAFAKKLAEKEKALKDAKMAHLVNLYKAMEPVKAGVIMDKMKMESVVKILGQMRGKSAGKIVETMDPKKGARISEALSRAE